MNCIYSSRNKGFLKPQPPCLDTLISLPQSQCFLFHLCPCSCLVVAQYCRFRKQASTNPGCKANFEDFWNTWELFLWINSYCLGDGCPCSSHEVRNHCQGCFGNSMSTHLDPLLCSHLQPKTDMIQACLLTNLGCSWSWDIQYWNPRWSDTGRIP